MAIAQGRVPAKACGAIAGVMGIVLILDFRSDRFWTREDFIGLLTVGLFPQVVNRLSCAPPRAIATDGRGRPHTFLCMWAVPDTHSRKE